MGLGASFSPGLHGQRSSLPVRNFLHRRKKLRLPDADLSLHDRSLRHPHHFTRLHKTASQRGPRMSVAIITGSAGLVGSEAVLYFSNLGFDVVGIDNGMRADFFGPEASTHWVRDRLRSQVPGYVHLDVDIRNAAAISEIFARYSRDVSVVIHAAAQPSHDWAASNPPVDFSVNANGTSVLLEATR